MISRKEDPGCTFNTLLGSPCWTSGFIAHKLYLPQNTKTPLSPVLCHFTTRIAFLPVSSNVFLISEISSEWALTSIFLVCTPKPPDSTCYPVPKVRPHFKVICWSSTPLLGTQICLRVPLQNRPGGSNNRNQFLIVLEAGKAKTKVPADLVSGKRVPFLACRWPPSGCVLTASPLCVHVVWKESSLLFSQGYQSYQLKTPYLWPHLTSTF